MEVIDTHLKLSFKGQDLDVLETIIKSKDDYLNKLLAINGVSDIFYCHLTALRLLRMYSKEATNSKDDLFNDFTFVMKVSFKSGHVDLGLYYDRYNCSVPFNIRRGKKSVSKKTLIKELIVIYAEKVGLTDEAFIVSKAKDYVKKITFN